MSDLLFDSQPLVINPDLAILIGLNEAIVLQQIKYWINLNKKANKSDHFKDEKWWTYNTYPEWIKNNFPFWSESTLIRTIKRLEVMNLITSTDKYNQKKYDNTKWYTVNDEEIEKLKEKKASSQNDQTVKAPSQNDQTIYSNCTEDLVKMTRPIPETNTETNTETNIDHNNNAAARKIGSSTIDPKLGNVFTIFEQELGRFITPFEREQIIGWYDQTDDQRVVLALRKAVQAGIRNFRYMDSIIREWDKKGLRSVIEIQQEDEKFHQKQEGRYKQEKNHSSRTTTPGNKYDQDTYN